MTGDCWLTAPFIQAERGEINIPFHIIEQFEYRKVEEFPFVSIHLKVLNRRERAQTQKIKGGR